MADQADGERRVAGTPLEHPPSVQEALSWIGFRLDDVAGSAFGRIEGVLVDADDGEPAWIVARTRLRHRSAIPAEFVAPGARRVWVPFSREAVRTAPEVDPVAGLEAATELELYRHYEVSPAGGGRRARLEGRGADTLTCLPASERS
jgi:hypothetical protein